MAVCQKKMNMTLKTGSGCYAARWEIVRQVWTCKSRPPSTGSHSASSTFAVLFFLQTTWTFRNTLYVLNSMQSSAQGLGLLLDGLGIWFASHRKQNSTLDGTVSTCLLPFSSYSHVLSMWHPLNRLFCEKCLIHLLGFDSRLADGPRARTRESTEHSSFPFKKSFCLDRRFDIATRF